MPTTFRNYSFPPLAQGQRNTITLPRDATIHQILMTGNFDVGAVNPTLAQWPTYITRIELLIDSRPVWDISMANYVAWLQYHGVTTEAGTLPLFFERPWEDLKEIHKHGRLGTLDLNNLQLRLTFANLAINSFRLTGLVDTLNEPIAQFFGFTERPENVNSAGRFDIEAIPSGKSYGTAAMHINNANIADVELFFGTTQFDESIRVERIQIDAENGRVPQAGYTHVDLTRGGDVRDTLDMSARDFRVRINATAVLGNVTILHEYLQDFSVNRVPLA